MEFVKYLAKRSLIEGEVPSLGSGIAFTLAFSFFFAVTFVSCIHFHQWWFLGSWGLGLVLEIAGYSGRIWYNINSDNSHAYIMQSGCITIAPCFLMAGIYNILGQLVLIYGNQFSALRPRKYTRIFITCDVIAVLVQSAGGGLSASNGSNLGRYIVIVGLVFQLVMMTIFQYLWYKFLHNVNKSELLYGEAQFNPQYNYIRRYRKLLQPFIVSVSIAVILIYVRCIYRVIETGMGYNSYLLTNEIYFNILEGMMIALAALLLAILSPGLVYGKDAHLNFKKNEFEYSSDKESGEFETNSSKPREVL